MTAARFYFDECKVTVNAWKVSEYGAFSVLYFPTFGLNMARYGVSLRIQYECRKLRTRKNSVFRHFSRSDGECSETLFSRTTHKKWNIKISKNPGKYGPVWRKILTQNQNKCVLYLSSCSETSNGTCTAQ